MAGTCAHSHNCLGPIKLETFLEWLTKC
jgi:hypothetical protein